jgi:hypothetical protein
MENKMKKDLNGPSAAT